MAKILVFRILIMLLALMRVLVAAGQIVVWGLQLLIFITGCILQATTALQAIMPRLGFQTKYFNVSFSSNFLFRDGWPATRIVILNWVTWLGEGLSTGCTNIRRLCTPSQVGRIFLIKGLFYKIQRFII